MILLPVPPLLEEKVGRTVNLQLTEKQARVLYLLLAWVKQHWAILQVHKQVEGTMYSDLNKMWIVITMCLSLMVALCLSLLLVY
jgi:folate-binding Fe-S cluster repair protein YgfZ